MKITPFATEQYFALYEFNTPHLLSVSDCETVSVKTLLDMAGLSPDRLSGLRLGYTESQGSPELRSLVADGYESTTAEEIVVLTSPVEGIYLTMLTLLEPDDEAIVLVPAYDALRNMAEFIGHRVHAWALEQTEDGWQMDLGKLEALIGPRSKLIVVNFPHNPTGYLPDADTFNSLISVARRHGLWLFCDEMYRGLEFGRAPKLPSAVDLYERCIVLSGLSKTHGLPGLRAGWLIVRDAEVRQAIMNWKYYTTICPAAPSELLALAALRAGEQMVGRNKEIIRKNIKLVDSFFDRQPDLFTWRQPLAGSVALVGINVTSATEYCHDLAKEAGVLLLPSSCMGYGDAHVRFGFGRTTFAAALEHYEEHLTQKPTS